MLSNLLFCRQNISESVEGDYTYLRVNFFTPSTTIGKGDVPIYNDEKATYLKEV